MSTKKLAVLTLILASVMLIDASQGGPLLHSKSSFSKGQTLSAYITSNLLARRPNERRVGIHSYPTPTEVVVEGGSPTPTIEPTGGVRKLPTGTPTPTPNFAADQYSGASTYVTPTVSPNIFDSFFGGMTYFGGAPKPTETKPSEPTPTKAEITSPTSTPTNAPSKNNSIQLTVTRTPSRAPTFTPVNNSEAPSFVAPTIAEKQAEPEKPKSKNIFDNFFDSIPYFDRVAKSAETKAKETDKDKLDSLKEIKEVERSKRLLESFDKLTKSMGPLGSLLKKTFEQYLK